MREPDAVSHSDANRDTYADCDYFSYPNSDAYADGDALSYPNSDAERLPWWQWCLSEPDSLSPSYTHAQPNSYAFADSSLGVEYLHTASG